MILVEIGRLTTPIQKSQRTSFAVITAIQDKNYVIVQSPLSMNRHRVSLKSLKLLDICIPLKIDSSKFDVQRCIDSHGAIKEFEATADYKECSEMNEYLNANDFERFLIDMKKRVEMDVLRESNII